MSFSPASRRRPAIVSLLVADPEPAQLGEASAREQCEQRQPILRIALPAFLTLALPADKPVNEDALEAASAERLTASLFVVTLFDPRRREMVGHTEAASSSLRLEALLGTQTEPNGLGTECGSHIHGHARIEIEPSVADDQVRRSGTKSLLMHAKMYGSPSQVSR